MRPRSSREVVQYAISYRPRQTHFIDCMGREVEGQGHIFGEDEPWLTERLRTQATGDVGQVRSRKWRDLE